MKLKFLIFTILSFVLLTISVEAQTKRTKTEKKQVTTVATNEAQAQAAISLWYDLNVLCRGGSGDDSSTDVACCARAKVSALLNQMGYCYRTGERWVKCTARDKKATLSTESCSN